MAKYISIKEARYLNNFKIYFQFNDGKEQTIDFENFISKSQHRDIKKYHDTNLFKRFNLKYGEIQWNDYELVFPIYDLYNGNIE